MNRRQFVIGSSMVTLSSAAPLLAFDTDHAVPELSTKLLPFHSGSMVDVARNRAAYQSSAIDDDHTAHLITDGTDLTYWQAGGPGQHSVEIDLGDARRVHRIFVRWGNVPPTTVRVEALAGDAPSHWTLLYTSTNVSEKELDIVASQESIQRIRIIGSSSEKGFTITRVHAWGDSGAAMRETYEPTVHETGSELDKGWVLLSSRFNDSPPEEISSPRFHSQGWLPALVPGTVLSSYLAHGSVPDPFFGDQQTQVSEDFFTHSDFWYRNTFEIAADCTGRRLWLNFEGINWKADVYLNGTLLGRIEGAFTRSRFNITKVANCGGKNCVAVLVHRVSHPAPVQHKKLGKDYPSGGEMGLDSPTFVASSSWNWLPTIRGRNIGIWNHVRFETSGDIRLNDPWVISHVDPSNLKTADLVVRTEIQNVSDKAAEFELVLTWEGRTFTKKLHADAGQSMDVAIDKSEWPGLRKQDPKLWWPNGYGEPALHSMSLIVKQGERVSDAKDVVFGIRSVEYKIETGVLNIHVNGQKILCRGGNWGMDHGMLACDRDGYDLRLRMHADMNLVMIRNWVGMVGRSEFYEACDRHGMLIWDDFWIANPKDGPEPADEAMFMANAMDKIRRVRSHPSLVLYCGRNESYPPPSLDKAMREAVEKLDGSRYYIPHSAADLVTGFGPYYNEDPAWYFANRGKTFHSELGLVCVPPVESMRAMMPEKDLWPISDMWAIHDYQQPRSVDYTKRIEKRYGPASGIEDYCRKAQMVNFETAKAMFECLRSHQGGGLLIWMSQAAWPALICQLYDYYFEQTAAYFAVKTACQPLHIFWDQSQNVIRVANNSISDRESLTAEAHVYSMSGKKEWSRSISLTVAAHSASHCFPLDGLNERTECKLIRLVLQKDGKVLAENSYWSANRNGDCLALNDLTAAELQAQASLSMAGGASRIVAHITNSSPFVSVATRIRTVNSGGNRSVLPVMYQDNYFSLLPGETRQVEIKLLGNHAVTDRYELRLSGWNVTPHSVRVSMPSR